MGAKESAHREVLDELSRRFDSQSAFVGSITHAIKGLLNGLEGGLYLLESGRRKGDGARGQEGEAMLRRNLLQARSLVSNVLYYAKDRAVNREFRSLSEVLEGCSTGCRRLAGSVGVTLETTAEEGAVSADGHALQALLANLAETAIDAVAGGDGADHRLVRIVASRSGDGAAFLLQHSGKRLDGESLRGALGAVFTPSGSDRTGLRIHAAKRIAVAHGGSLRVEPVPGRGERYTVIIPDAPPEANAGEEEPHG